MDFFGSWRPSPSINKNVSIQKNEMAIAKDIAEKEKLKKKKLARIKERNLKLNKQFRAGVKAAESGTARFVGGATEAVGIGMRQQPDFSQEQKMLGSMFGQGEKTWGINNQPVTINNDLNPSRSNPFDETAGMFGFGGNGERSELF